MMVDEMIKIMNFMIAAFGHIWPYLLITVPIAVAVNMSGASRYIKSAFDAGPITAILLATLVGAFSPFCSCGVIPVIASLLIGGVPLAPVMAFWIASPSMDPEIFFLSVGTIGRDLAIWRLGGTLVMSLGAGFITHAFVRAGWIRGSILKHKGGAGAVPGPSRIKRSVVSLASNLKNVLFLRSGAPVAAAACCNGEAGFVSGIQPSVPHGRIEPFAASGETSGCRPGADDETSPGRGENASFYKRLGREAMDAALMVFKFMALAFFLEALIVLYVPEAWITGIVGRDNSWAIIMAAFLGIPVYTSSLSALPMVAGLLTQGMSPAAALAFLIAGPTTTLPAMAAVWTLVKYRIFILYVSFALLGAVLLGYLKLLLG